MQVRCNNPNYCNTRGTKVVLTDLQGDTRTDFVLSAKAFSDMAKNGLDKSILKLGIVDVEYKRYVRMHACMPIDLIIYIYIYIL